MNALEFASISEVTKDIFKTPYRSKQVFLQQPRTQGRT